VRDPAGIIPGSTTLPAMLSSHTTVSNPICVLRSGMAYVVQAATANTATPTADVYMQQYNQATGQSTCVIPAGSTSMGTVTFTPNAAGNIGIISGGTALNGLNRLNNTFVANVNGTMRMGNFYPAGTPVQTVSGTGGGVGGAASVGGGVLLVNKTAADAMMNALGFPVL